MMATLFPRRLTKQQIGLALLIFALAFALRVTVSIERAGSDDIFIPVRGTDPYTYLQQARGILDGTFPTAPFYFHPAPAYVFALLIRLLGDSVPVIVLAVTLLDSLTVGLLIAAGWLLTRRPAGGYLAGLIYACYPLAMFYSTTALIAPQAAFVLTLLITLTLWQREELAWWRTILMGISAGGLVLMRLNLAPVPVMLLLWMLFQHKPPRLAHAALYSLLALLVIAPVTLHNYRTSGGQFIPVATTGTAEIYLGNNRDSNGQNSKTIAFMTNDIDYQSALMRDIQVAPERFVGLLIYKFALFWDAGDVGNNVDFNDAVIGSPLLRLPLTFSLLSLLALPALVLLWREDRKLALLFGLIIANLCATFLLVFVFGRLRHPVSPVLVLLGAYGVMQLLSAERRIALRPYLMSVCAVALMLLACRWVLHPAPRLPAERTYASLPQDARVVDAQFGEVILRGWRPVSGWEAAFREWARPRNAYAIELFWQVTQPVSNEYLFNLRYQHGAEARAETSERLGTVSFPGFPTPLWDPETIYGEIVSLRFNHDVDGYESGQIRIGVWYWDSEGLIVNVPFSADSNDIALQPLAIYGTGGVASVPADALQFGQQIALTQIQVPDTIRAGQDVTVRLYWMATAEVERDLHLFLHLEDDSGTLVAQHDGLPVPDLPTRTWMPGYELVAEYTLSLPDQAGEYRLYAGLYDEAGRLSVNAPDNRPLLLTLSAGS